MQGGDSDDEIAELRIQALLTKRENEAEVSKSPQNDHGNLPPTSNFQRSNQHYDYSHAGRYQRNNRRGYHSQPYRPFKMNPYHPNFAGKTVNTSNIVVLTSSENENTRRPIPTFDPNRPPPSLPRQIQSSSTIAKPSTKLILPQERYSNITSQQEEPKPQINAKMKRLQGSSSNDDSSDSSDDSSSESSSDSSSSDDTSSDDSGSSKSDSTPKKSPSKQDEAADKTSVLPNKNGTHQPSTRNFEGKVSKPEWKSPDKTIRASPPRTKQSRSKSPIRRERSVEDTGNRANKSPRHISSSSLPMKRSPSPFQSRYRSRSRDRYRAVSPIKNQRRSFSPMNERFRDLSQRSHRKSPYRDPQNRALSPINRIRELPSKYHSPSPRRFRSSRSPDNRRRSKSKSPYRYRSRSPLRRERLSSYSPRRRQFSRSPIPRKYPSPFSQFKERSPLRKRKMSRSRSPTRGVEKRSPLLLRKMSPKFAPKYERISPYRRKSPIQRNSPPRKRFRSRSPVPPSPPLRKPTRPKSPKKGRSPLYGGSPPRYPQQFSRSPQPLMSKRIKPPFVTKEPPREKSRYRQDLEAMQEKEKSRIQLDIPRNRAALAYSKPLPDLQRKEVKARDHRRPRDHGDGRRETSTMRQSQRELDAFKHQERNRPHRSSKDSKNKVSRDNNSHVSSSRQKVSPEIVDKVDARIIINRRREPSIDREESPIRLKPLSSLDHEVHNREKRSSKKASSDNTSMGKHRPASTKKHDGKSELNSLRPTVELKVPANIPTLRKSISPCPPVKGPRTPSYSPEKVPEEVENSCSLPLTSSPFSKKPVREQTLSPIRQISSPDISGTVSPLKKANISSSKESIEEGLCSQQESEDPSDSSLPSFHIKTPVVSESESHKSKLHKKKKKKEKDSKSHKKSKKKKHKEEKDKKHKRRSKEKKHKKKKSHNESPVKQSKGSRGFSITVEPGARRIITQEKPSVKERLSEPVPTKLPVHMRLGPAKPKPKPDRPRRQEANWTRNPRKRHRRD